MSELVERLRVALDEAEKRARAATVPPWTVEPLHRRLPRCRCLSCYEEQPYAWTIAEVDVIGDEPTAVLGEADARHIAAWDPARVLRLIERDRALLLALASAQANTTEWLERSAGQPESKTLGQYFDGSKNALLREVERAADFWLGDNHG